MTLCSICKRHDEHLLYSGRIVALQDDRLQDVMADLRGKFKALIAMTGLKGVYPPEAETSPQSVAF